MVYNGILKWFQKSGLGVKRLLTLKGLCGNKGDAKTLQCGFQGEGGAEGELGRAYTLAELAAKDCVRHTMIAYRERKAIKGMADTFFGAGGRTPVEAYR